MTASVTSNVEMSPWLKHPFIEMCWVALLYVVSARVGQTFAIEPGNVTAVWLPSGIMVALTFIRGAHIWPGVFLGAFIGNVWAYFSLDSWTVALQSLFAGTCNGIGDVLSTVGAVLLFLKVNRSKNVITNFSSFALFLLFCAFLGPGISALFGVTSLAMMKFLPWSDYWSTTITWWTGDGVGALLFAPLILAWSNKLSNKKNNTSFTSTVLLVCFSILIACIFFKLIATPLWLYILAYCLAPILLLASLYFGQHNCFSSIVAFSSVAIIATSLNLGPFSSKNQSINLVELQLFIAVMTLVFGFLSITVRQRLEAEIEIRKREKSLLEAQQLANLGNWELDLKTDELFWSDEVFRIFEVDPKHFKATYESFLTMIHPDDKDLVNIAYKEALANQTPYNIEHRLLMKDGRIKYVNERGETEYSETGEPVRSIGTVLDITERKLAEQKIVYQAHYDSLTKLPNRFLTLDRLSQLLREADRENTKIAVLFLDLDFFKHVNDSMGHEAGDKLLIEVAERLRKTVRADDTVGRLGGDEFLILLRGIHSIDEAMIAIENLLDCCRTPFLIDDRKFTVSSSIGVVMYPGDGNTPEEVLRNADLAMYLAKEQGRNSYSFFTAEINSKVSRNLAIDREMQGALKRNEFSVHYQVQVDIPTQKINRAEALLRWHNQTLGHVTPDEFIPVAESNGVIVELGQFVIEQTLSLLADLQQNGNKTFAISVNLSPRQFRDPNLVNFIRNALTQHGVPSTSLEFEITEGLLINGYANEGSILDEIHKMGVKISLDDFGTGFASLNYLKKYPFDELKIDRVFINDIEQKDGRELVNAAIAMSHALGLIVVAEGVETELQLNILQSMGCDFAQGYLFSKPLPTDRFIAYLDKKSS